MGTCISKCRPGPSPTKHPCLPQDKLVISQSPCIASSTRISHGHQHSSSTPSSSSSSSATSASSSFCASSCSSSSLSKDGYPTRDSPWSSVRRHPHLIVLDPENKQSPLGPKPVKFSGQAAATASNPGTPARSQPPKRARSTSPVLVRQKSFRSSPEQSSAVPTRGLRQPPPFSSTLQGTVARPRPPSLVGHRSSGREFQQNMVPLSKSTSMASPSPGHRFGTGDRRGRPKWMPEESPTRVAATRDNKPKTRHVPTRKERLQLSSPFDAGHHAPRLKRREASVHPVGAQVEQEGSENIISDRDCGCIHAEDMNNPLISLDCFIFL